MRPPWSGRVALWYAAAFFAGASIRLLATRPGATDVDAVMYPTMAIGQLSDTASFERLSALVDTVLAYDPMDARVDVVVAVDPVPSPPPEPVRPPAPALMLRGVVGGPPWMALLEGVPGQTGAVMLAQGDTLGMLRVVRVMADAVVLRDADSTWTLQLAATWR